MAEIIREHPKVPPSLFSDEPFQNQMGPLGVQSTMINAQGIRLATYWWPATTKSTKAVVQLCHGTGAYCMEFLRAQGVGKPVLYEGSWIQQWNAAGIAVCGHDHQGSGFSDDFKGHRSYFESFDDLLADTVQLRRSLGEAPIEGFSASQVFLVGISLGGCLSLKAAMGSSDLWRGVVLLAPMISLEKVAKAGLNPYLLPLSRFVSYLFPTWQVAKVSPNPNQELKAQWDHDPLNFQGYARARTATEYMRATTELLPMLSETNFSWLCFHGDSDTLCDIEGSQLLLKQSKSDDKELVILKDRWHAVIKEQGEAEVCSKIKEWVCARTS